MMCVFFISVKFVFMSITKHLLKIKIVKQDIYDKLLNAVLGGNKYNIKYEWLITFGVTC